MIDGPGTPSVSALEQMGSIDPGDLGDERVAPDARLSLSCAPVPGLNDCARAAGADLVSDRKAEPSRAPVVSDDSTGNGEHTMGDVSAGSGQQAAGGATSTLRQDLDSSSGGYEMVFAGVIFALVGLWLDRQLGWTPILTIVLAVLGFVGGVLGVYYRYKRDITRIEAETAALRGRLS